MSSKTMVPDAEMREVIEKYKTTVYGIAVTRLPFKADADDIFQEVFLAYYKGRPTFESEEHRKAWLIRTTVNLSKKSAQSSWRKRTVQLEHAEQLPFLFDTDEQNDIYAALRRLPDKYRTVLHLFYFEDMPSDEIAQTLKQNPAAVRMRLSRARELLRKEMKGVFQDE